MIVPHQKLLESYRTHTDVMSIFKEAKASQVLNTSMLKLLCYFTSLCGKDKELRFREKAVKHFEKHLDIRSFVGVPTNLALALSLLFTKEQLLLVQHHHARAVSEEQLGQDSDKSSSEASDDLI